MPIAFHTTGNLSFNVNPDLRFVNPPLSRAGSRAAVGPAAALKLIRTNQKYKFPGPKVRALDSVSDPLALVRGIPKCFLRQVFLLEAWGTEANKTTHLPETTGLLALPPKAARLNNYYFSGNLRFLACAPSLQQTLGPNTTSGSL